MVSGAHALKQFTNGARPNRTEGDKLKCQLNIEI